ncbi:adenylate/guanylate cyclase domain-containing protein [Mesorhizobium sp. VK4C]|uniref:adenylate/guanylate cyclase domain-containing protein n=1 Tax=Mesorhizobium captivum TaxID=3072319 RepID=UPI002A24293D|nr:adenylate/guanylate cyclase domain-containing protein [Mesorhizobium sp. VK4C]MDX8500722.1 adenylate/guanylate cyclase domain-containing protein [Mesorhizobium sp. VK4C]
MSTPAQSVRLVRPEKKRRRIPIAVIMALSFGTLVFLSVGGVLALSVGANFRNTFDLLGAQSTLLIDAMEDSLRAEMGDAENAVNGIAQLYAQGEFQIGDEAMSAAVAGALAAASGVEAMLICTPDLVCRGAARSIENNVATGAIEHFPAEPEKSPQVRAALEQRRRVGGRQWGAFVANEFGLYAHVSVPLARDGVTQAWVIAAVELRKLSDITRELSSRFGTHAFILDGEDRVLADQRLADPDALKNGVLPLTPLATYGDPVLAAYSSREVGREFDTRHARDIEIAEIRVDDRDDSTSWEEENTYIAITRKITGYGDKPWTIGGYFESSQISDEIERVMGSALLGLGAMAVAVIVAILLGRRLSRPIQAIAGQATRVADFDLDGITPLPRSRVLELDNQASAFNAMLIGLRAFSTYIPRSLVAKLVRTREVGIAEPREAVVTVMFTDITGFTTLSEQMDAAAAARLLNHHFAILCGAVDAHGGTVDKFLGDGMLAFFGAPDRLNGHAAAAVRAAAAIREQLEKDNLEAAGEGRPPLDVRIGIHTGAVIVGNIGASDRVNYTIVGDTVNVSQRLQDLGKHLEPGATAAIAISGETASRLDEKFETIPAGKHRLRGRGEATEVFKLGKVATSASPRMDVHRAQVG